MQSTFYSNGKLLLTGEYVVLDGATALAIPTKKGQSLSVKNSTTEDLIWESFDFQETCWFSATFALPDLSIKETNNAEIAKTLVSILKETKKQNPNFLSDTIGASVRTHLDFPRDWGLGSSSTLINNIAQWAKVDAYSILRNSFGGSGYDIAVAQQKTPIFYTIKDNLPLVKNISLPWDFTNQLFFVHLNRKQDSKKGIAAYKKMSVSKKQLTQITDLTRKLLVCYTLTDFENILKAHERIISEIIQTPTIKDQLFADYPGTIKSLGAWGGDFILTTGKLAAMNYFKDKGYDTIIPFAEMAL